MSQKQETPSFRGCPQIHRGQNPESVAMHIRPIDSRHPWRSRCAPPAAFALAILPTQSGSVADEAGDGPGMTKE
ncbi:MAG: hypothetical protein OJF55_000024 [Rhodanobacteraceae bacterium]|jgi:hypothetical protein|nr:MAG: hypothetical protein OJF55_000024 [Rhodanobacteraceae bacterium]